MGLKILKDRMLTLLNSTISSIVEYATPWNCPCMSENISSASKMTAEFLRLSEFRFSSNIAKSFIAISSSEYLIRNVRVQKELESFLR